MCGLHRRVAGVRAVRLLVHGHRGVGVDLKNRKNLPSSKEIDLFYKIYYEKKGCDTTYPLT